MLRYQWFAFAFLLVGINAGSARAEVTACTNITVLPSTISSPGIYCLKQDLNTAITSGAAITINANNVTLDMNGFKLGGMAGGADTQADGIYSLDRLNITIRNGTVRGFNHNIRLGASSETASSGHLVEDIRSEGARYIGISVQGSSSTIRRNFVFGVGNGPSVNAYGIVGQMGSGISVLDNEVNGVTETRSAVGIYTIGAPNSIVAMNNVRNINANSGSVGINSQGLIERNRVSNEAQGFEGISGNYTAACIDNLVRMFAFAISSCQYSNGNRTY